MRNLAAAALIATSSLAVAGPNLVVNGNFESGEVGWQKGDNMTIGLVATTDRGKSAGTGCIGPECLELPNYSSLNQTIHTTIGKTYELSFWVAEYLGSPSGFAVYWDGNLIERVMDPANNSLTFIGNNVFEGRWTQFMYKGLAASSASTGIELRGRHDPGGMHFDDISVVEDTATDIPEPGSLALLGLGALAMMGRRPPCASHFKNKEVPAARGRLGQGSYLDPWEQKAGQLKSRHRGGPHGGLRNQRC